MNFFYTIGKSYKFKKFCTKLFANITIRDIFSGNDGW